MNNYLSVLSNDGINHLSLPGSPETLCGRLVVQETHSPESLSNLACDTCSQLSNGDSFITEAAYPSIKEYPCPHCEDGLDPTGSPCWNCQGTGWVGSEDSSLDLTDPFQINDLDLNDLHGVKVADSDSMTEAVRDVIKPIQPVKPPIGLNADANPSTPPHKSIHLLHDEKTAFKVEAGVWECALCGTDNDTRAAQCDGCGADRQVNDSPSLEDTGQIPGRGFDASFENEHQRFQGFPQGFSSNKEATNWTRDGYPIEDNIVMITREEAARIPFLDLSKVRVSEKKICPDCHEEKWINIISSCNDCGQMKCNNCFEEIGLDSFFGRCKTCVSASSDLDYETTYEDAIPDQERYLAYALGEEDRDEYDSLFLPYGDLG